MVFTLTLHLPTFGRWCHRLAGLCRSCFGWRAVDSIEAPPACAGTISRRTKRLMAQARVSPW